MEVVLDHDGVEVQTWGLVVRVGVVDVQVLELVLQVEEVEVLVEVVDS